MIPSPRLHILGRCPPLQSGFMICKIRTTILSPSRCTCEDEQTAGRVHSMGPTRSQNWILKTQRWALDKTSSYGKHGGTRQLIELEVLVISRVFLHLVGKSQPSSGMCSPGLERTAGCWTPLWMSAPLTFHGRHPCALPSLYVKPAGRTSCSLQSSRTPKHNGLKGENRRTISVRRLWSR